MSEENKIAKWLQRLQQNSWEPEIFISGIIIFSLFQIPDYLEKYRLYVAREIDVGNNGDVIFAAITVGIYWLILGFTFHLFTRGIWGSLIGLSYVFPKGIIKSNVKYADKFQRKLEEFAPLEDNINSLEKLSSSIFSISFFLFMSMIAVCLWFLFLLLIVFIYIQTFGYTNSVSLPIFALIYIVASLLYLFDFVSLGLLKKNRIVALLFYPIHWFFSRLSLAGLYRNVYYTYLTNFKKWKLVVALLVYIVISGTAITWKVAAQSMGRDIGYSNIDFMSYRGNLFVESNKYDDQKANLTADASIQSEIIRENVLRLFVVNQYKFERIFQDSLNYQARIDSAKNSEEERAVLLESVKTSYKVQLDDSLYNDVDWLFHIDPKTHEKGLLSWIDITHLDKGRHTIVVKFGVDFGVGDGIYTSIPFYKLVPADTL